MGVMYRFLFKNSISIDSFVDATLERKACQTWSRTLESSQLWILLVVMLECSGVCFLKELGYAKMAIEGK